MEIESFLLSENGWVPNNSRLPVVIYRRALVDEANGLADRFEALFQDHGWFPDWRDGVFGYPHYHSTAHEALGVFAGEATLELGGPGGRNVSVAAGDALMLPAGTGHRAVLASQDFQVVGAYPEEQNWDICRGAPDDAARAGMEALPEPKRDPVTGATEERAGAQP